MIMNDYHVVNRNGTTMSLHLLTRDFQYMTYNLSTYTEIDKMEKTFELLLNRSALEDAECRDLNYHKRFVPARQGFVFFCQLLREVEHPQVGRIITTFNAYVYLNQIKINT